MADFTRKYTKEIFDNFMAEYNSLRQKYNDENAETAPILPKSVVKSLGYAFSAEISTLWSLLTNAIKQCFPQSADLPALKMWGGLVGIDYKYGQNACLLLEIENVNAQFLDAGATFKDLSSGLIYQSTSRANTNNGSVLTTVKCLTGGTVGNLAVGTELTLTENFEGIPQTATVKSISIVGSDDENREEYRKRVLLRFKSKPRGGTIIDFYNWTLEATGIIDCLPYVLEEGKITLYLVSEGSGQNRTPTGANVPNPFPQYVNGQIVPFTGSGQFLEVAQKIEGDSTIGFRRLLNAKVELKAPVHVPVSIAITGLTGNDNGEFNQIIKSSIIEYLDKRRPNILALNYTTADAIINKYSLTGIVTDVIDGNTFSGISVKNKKNVEIDEFTLDIGELCYLQELTINGTVIK
jgi:uncharacterized phage protein gp47/JayE